MPAASYALLLPNLKKCLFFAIGEGSTIFVACFLHSSAQRCSYQTPGRRPPRVTGHFVNTDRRVCRSPLPSAPRSDFMAQSLVLSIDVCRGLGISPLRLNIWLSFSQADLGPRSAQELFFWFFKRMFETVSGRFVLIASGTEIFWQVFLKFELFLASSRFHCHRSKRSAIFWGSTVGSDYYEIIVIRIVYGM